MIGGDRFGGWEYHTIYEVGEGVTALSTRHRAVQFLDKRSFL